MVELIVSEAIVLLLSRALDTRTQRSPQGDSTECCQSRDRGRRSESSEATALGVDEPPIVVTNPPSSDGEH